MQIYYFLVAMILVQWKSVYASCLATKFLTNTHILCCYGNVNKVKIVFPVSCKFGIHNIHLFKKRITKCYKR